MILDEVHDREIDMDLLMTIVKEFLLINSETKVILMSATFNPKIFVKYFTYHIQDEELKPAVIQLKTKRKFNIEIKYLDDIKALGYPYDEMNVGISSEIYEVAKKLILKRLSLSKNSILVFLPGIYEIETLNAILSSDPEINEKALICYLHSSMATVDQRIAFKPATKPKIVLSTNIAESSVTIENDCVIDFCLTKYMQKCSNTSIASLKLDWASQSSLEQRAGRTGRTCHGTCYRLIYRRFYDMLLEFTTPEMQRCSLETVVLRVKMLTDENPTAFLSKALSPPLAEDVRKSIKVLKELYAIERLSAENKFIHSDGKLTYLGRIMATLPLDVRVSKLIILGYTFSLLDEAIIIAAGLNVKSIFSVRHHDKLEIYYNKLKWAAGSNCDMIAILNAYKLWQFKQEQAHIDNESEFEWCSRNNLERRSLHEMRQLIREINERLISLNLEKLGGVSWDARQKPLILKICFAGSFLPNWFMIGSPSEVIEDQVYKTTIGRDPTKTIYFKGMDPAYIGLVYEDQIKKRLVEFGICRSRNDVKVIFEKLSTKVFIQFVDEKSMIDDDENCDSSNLAAGRIKPEVYKAVKMRQLNSRFLINVMSPEETRQYAEEQGIDTNERDIFARQAGLMSHPELCVIPLTCVEELLGKVTYIDHCNKFYIQPVSEANQKLLLRIHNDLMHGKVVFNSITCVGPFQFVAVLDSDVIFKRARAVNISKKNQTVTCFLIDYGETKRFPFSRVFGLPEALHHQVLKIPERCFVASLSEIAPSCVKCPRSKWTTEAIELFRNLALDEELVVKVYSVVEEIASVELWIEDVCVNKELIDAGFAQEFEESYTKKHNHELRKGIQTSSGAPFGPEVEFASRFDTLTNYVQSPPENLCHERVSLIGPFSPLETRPLNILVHDNLTESIDPFSVNSVLLYEDPGNSCGRLLVAANATENQRKVVLHETSVMPDVPGLQVLLALIFAPDVIIKHNEDKSQFESIQFGLGCNPTSREPYFSQNDCILPVNIVLDDHDFRDINYLRCTMSYLLMNQPQETIGSHDNATKQKTLIEIKDLILKILNKKRLPLPSSCASNRKGRWPVEVQSDRPEYLYKELFYGGGLYHVLPTPKLLPLDDAKKENLKRALKIAHQEVFM